MLKKLLPLTLAALLCHPAIADETSVKKAIETKLGAKVTSVTKTPYLGLYEVYANGQIIYTDEKQSVLIGGPLIDGKTMKNYTNERMQKLSAINFSELPFEHAIKQVRGDGKRTMVTFEDPNCGFCKKLAKDIVKLDNVTIYTFLMPILSPDSLQKSNKIWCSANKAAAWNEWMIDGKTPASKGDCDTSSIKKNVELGQKLNINGTPTIFFTDGTRFPGAIPMAQIEQKLNETSK